MQPQPSVALSHSPLTVKNPEGRLAFELTDGVSRYSSSFCARSTRRDRGIFEVRGEVADALELAGRIARPHLGARRAIALGVAGGLWLSALFLHRVNAMRLAAPRVEKKVVRAVRARCPAREEEWKGGPSGEQSGHAQTGSDLSRRERKCATHLSQSSAPPCTRLMRRPSPPASVSRSALAYCRRRPHRARR